MITLFTKNEKELLNITNDSQIRKYNFFKIGANAYLDGYDYDKLKEAIDAKNVLITDKEIINILQCSNWYLNTKNAVSYFTITGVIIDVLGLEFEEGYQSKIISNYSVNNLYEKENLKMKDVASVVSMAVHTLQNNRKKYGVLFDNGFKLYRRGIKIELLQSELILKRQLPKKEEIADIMKVSMLHDFSSGTDSHQKIDYIIVLGVYLRLLNKNVAEILEKHQKLPKYDLDNEIKVGAKIYYD